MITYVYNDNNVTIVLLKITIKRYKIKE